MSESQNLFCPKQTIWNVYLPHPIFFPLSLSLCSMSLCLIISLSPPSFISVLPPLLFPSPNSNFLLGGLALPLFLSLFPLSYSFYCFITFLFLSLLLACHLLFLRTLPSLYKPLSSPFALWSSLSLATHPPPLSKPGPQSSPKPLSPFLLPNSLFIID